MTQGVTVTTQAAADAHTDRVLRSGATLAAGRVAARLISIARMLTIARWLGPGEMGVFGAAMLALSTADAFSQTGLKQALIQKDRDVEPSVGTVQTILIVRGLLVGLCLFLAAPWVALFFHVPQATGLIRITALLPVIAGFENMAVALWQRNLEFRPIVWLQISSAVAGLAVAVAYAAWRPDAWSLVWGQIAAALVNAGGSSLLARRWPRFEFAPIRVRDLHAFGIWITLSAIVTYVAGRAGDWMIGRAINLEALAHYQMAMTFASVIAVELGGVVLQVSFPAMSRVQRDRRDIASGFLKTVGMVSLTGGLGAAAFCACAPDAYALLLGQRWLAGLGHVPWLMLYASCCAVACAAMACYWACGHPRLQTLALTLMMVLRGALLFPMVAWLGPVGVAATMGITEAALLVLHVGLTARLLGLRASAIVRRMAVPLAAAAAGAAAAMGLRPLVALPAAAGMVAAGLTASVLTLTLAWLLGRLAAADVLGDFWRTLDAVRQRRKIAASKV